jgi:hypothetical protein
MERDRRLAALVERGGPLRAIGQLDTQKVFQHPELHAHRRPGEADSISGARDIAVFRHGNERFQVSQVR